MDLEGTLAGERRRRAPYPCWRDGGLEIGIHMSGEDYGVVDQVIRAAEGSVAERTLVRVGSG